MPSSWRGSGLGTNCFAPPLGSGPVWQSPVDPRTSRRTARSRLPGSIRESSWAWKVAEWPKAWSTEWTRGCFDSEKGDRVPLPQSALSARSVRYLRLSPPGRDITSRVPSSLNDPCSLAGHKHHPGRGQGSTGLGLHSARGLAIARQSSVGASLLTSPRSRWGDLRRAMEPMGGQGKTVVVQM